MIWKLYLFNAQTNPVKDSPQVCVGLHLSQDSLPGVQPSQASKSRRIYLCNMNVNNVVNFLARILFLITIGSAMTFRTVLRHGRLNSNFIRNNSMCAKGSLQSIANNIQHTMAGDGLTFSVGMGRLFMRRLYA